jgi:heme exporter protein D
MPDNWGYVFSAYGVAVVALVGYWRHLSGRAKSLAGRGERKGP